MIRSTLRKLKKGLRGLLPQPWRRPRQVRPQLEVLEDRTLLNADLQVTLTAPTTVAPGGSLAYTLTVTNTGSSADTMVTVGDPLPSQVQFANQSQTSGPAFTLSEMNNTVNDSIASLAAGASATIVINTTVGGLLTNGTVVSDTAGAGDNGGSTTSPTATTTVNNDADLAVSVSGPSSVIAGSDLTYALTLTNNGPQSAVSVQLQDALPAGETFVSQNQVSGPSLTLTQSNGTVNDGIASLPSGASATIDLVAQVGAGVAGNTTLSDTATVSASSYDPNSANNSSTAQTTVQPQANLAVSVSAPASVIAGNDLTYTVTVSNSGPLAAQDVTVASSLPAGLTLEGQSQTSGPDFTLGQNGNTVSDTITSLAAGASATFTVTGLTASSLANNSSLGSTVTVTGTNSPSASASATTTMQTQADVQIGMTGPATAGAGDSVNYTLTVTNNGPSDAQQVTVTDALPEGLTVSGQQQTIGPAFTLSNNGNTISGTIGTLPSGMTATLVVTALVAANTPNNTTITNTATVSAGTTDPNLANNSATVSTVVYPGGVTLTNPGNQAGTAHSTVSLQLQATDTTGGPGLTYSAIGLPHGLTLDASTGLITGTLCGCHIGTDVVTVTAADGASSASQTFLWQVNSVVTLDPVPTQSSPEGQAVSLQVQGSDSAGGTLAYSATGLPPDLSINASTGLISGTLPAGAAAAGPYTVTVTAADANGQASQSFTWQVTAAVGVTNPGTQSGTEGQSVSLQVQATNSSGGSMVYSAAGLPPGTSINPGTGSITGTLAYGSAANGPYDPVVTVSNGVSSASAAFTWNVASPITLTNPGNQSGTEGNNVSLQIQASDSSGASVAYAIVGQPPGLSINPTTGLITGTLASNDSEAGPFLTTVTAEDGNTSANVSFAWQVNSPIGISNPGPQSSGEGDAVSLQVQAMDSSGGTPSYTAVRVRSLSCA